MPAWEFSDHTLEIIEELGFEWDSSQMGNDFAPYHLRRNWKAPDSDPFELGDSTDIIEIPISWKRADFPVLMFVWEQSILWDTRTNELFSTSRKPNSIGCTRT
ncbi:polysaccharide deacetylase family protein [Haladaptatus cibarius]|uniref:hypothetical protein n=1 Tax=Haladaptatus cibarius TaxID=453847 RepID=UPI000A971D6D|nr:hypothetical protein [Haladaptatus cibarius]